MSNISLVGFMCTGKTQVGRRLAAALGMQFLDSDELIAARAGKSIERIFAEDGEAKFRQLERNAIAHLAVKRGLVISAGGGALGDKRNLADLRRGGPVVCLTASPEQILKRAQRAAPRPLLKVPNPRARVEELLALRAAQYAQADYHIDTTNISPAQAAAQALSLLTVVPVNLGERSYDIIIGRGLLAKAGEYLHRLGKYSRIAVVSEERVWQEHGAALASGLPEHHQVILPALEDQEKLKSLRFAERLYDEFLRLGLARDSLVIAFGGGTIGDLTGFAAATYMRGLDFVQIPTTLLAQVDSSIGGKVAVNHPRAKNLIGAFWQPKLVLADLHCLDTLPRQQFRNGLAEVIKHAILADARLFQYLEEHTDDIMRLYPPCLRHLLWRNCQIKAAVVSQDEKEAGLREILNLGHTFGHALETATEYSGLSHGEAVSIGVAAAGRLAYQQGLFSAAGLERMLCLLQGYHLPTAAPQIPLPAVLSAMKTDKKGRRGELRFVLPRRIGKVGLYSNIPPAALRRALTNDRSAAKTIKSGKTRHG